MRPVNNPVIRPITGPPKRAAMNVVVSDKSKATPGASGIMWNDIKKRIFPRAAIIATNAILFESKIINLGKS